LSINKWYKVSSSDIKYHQAISSIIKRYQISSSDIKYRQTISNIDELCDIEYHHLISSIDKWYKVSSSDIKYHLAISSMSNNIKYRWAMWYRVSSFEIKYRQVISSIIKQYQVSTSDIKYRQTISSIDELCDIEYRNVSSFYSKSTFSNSRWNDHDDGSLEFQNSIKNGLQIQVSFCWGGLNSGTSSSLSNLTYFFLQFLSSILY
jgi:hypothetical protein